MKTEAGRRDVSPAGLPCVSDGATAGLALIEEEAVIFAILRLLGLLAWGWIWGVFFARAGAVLKRLRAGLGADRMLTAGSLATVLGFLVAGLFEYNFGDSEVVTLAYLVMALPFIVERAFTTP